MKKCLVYFRNSEYDMSAEELIIKFKESDKWRDFLELHSEQKIIVPIDNANDFEYVLKQIDGLSNLVFIILSRYLINSLSSFTLLPLFNMSFKLSSFLII